MHLSQTIISAVGAAYIGGALGSFLHVCYWRIPRGQNFVSQPSRCPQCNQNIPWYLNQPIIGWVLARGRCAHCKTSIPLRYLSAEAASATFFLTLWFITQNPVITSLIGTGVGLIVTTTLINKQTGKVHRGLATAAFATLAAAAAVGVLQ